MSTTREQAPPTPSAEAWWVRRISRIGALREDTEDVRLQKTLLSTSTLFMASLAVLWGSLYAFGGKMLAASIPLGYAVLSFASLALFSRVRRYAFFRFSQLLLSLVLPFLLMLALGGFVPSSGVVLWSLTSPLGALVFAGRRQAVRWFGAYLGLLAVGFLIEPLLPPTDPLPPLIINLFFVLNLGGTSSVAFVLLYHYVSEQARVHQALEAAHQAQQQTLHRLVETQDQLVQSKKLAALGEMTAGIAHEIKNPLNFVNNFAELNAELTDELLDAIQESREKTVDEAVSRWHPLLEEIKDNARRIVRYGRRADGIIRTMGDHVRVGTARHEPTDLHGLLDESIELAYQGVCTRLPGFSAEIERAYDARIGLVSVAPQELSRVFINLLDNAFYAVRERAAEAPPSYAPAVAVRTVRQDGGVAVQIADNGVGVPDALAEKIFQPFFTTKPPGQGTGLGLSFSYDIITRGHGGTLTMERTAGGGTTVVVTLPGTV